MQRSRRQLLPQELRRKRRKIFFWKMGAYVFLIMLAVVVVGMAARLHAFRVSMLYIDGASVASEEAVRSILEKRLAGSSYLIFPRNNTLLISKASLRGDITDALPIIESVSIDRTGFTALTVEVTERTPRALWCSAAASATTASTSGTTLPAASEDCYAVDGSGLIFARASSLTAHTQGSTTPTFTKLYTDIDGSAPIGAYALDGEEFAAIQKVIGPLAELGLVMTEIHPLGTQDLEIHFANGLRVFVPIDESSTRAIENLALVISSDIFVGEKEKSVDYIDLRFGNKVFYKEASD